MTLFRYAAYLSPLILGFGVAAALALTSGRKPLRRAAVVFGVPASLLLVLGGAALADSFALLGPVAVLLAALTLLVAGLFLFCESILLPREVCQIVPCLAVVALMSTVFCFGPVLEHAKDVMMPADDIDRRITLALEVNPFMTMGYSIFNQDLLYLPGLYPLDLADYRHGRPSWGATSLGYAAFGLALGAVSIGLSFLRRRLFK